jgi:hypothetical protein
MALLQNIALNGQYPLRQKGGILTGDCCFWNQNHVSLSRFTASGFDKKSSSPSGSSHPYAWEWALRNGGLATFTQITGAAALTPGLRLNGDVEAAAPRLAGSGTISGAGLNGLASITVTLAGVGEIQTTPLNILAWCLSHLAGTGAVTTAELIGPLLFAAELNGEGVVNAVITGLVGLLADLVGEGSLTPDLRAFAVMASDLAGSGSLGDAALSVIAWCVANILGAGDVAGDVRGKSFMAASIAATGEALTAAGIAAAVWQALALAYDDPDTMGAKLNAAGTAGDPWTGIIEGDYTAKEIMQIIVAALAGKLSGAGTTEIVIRNLTDTADQIVAAVDAIGNREGVQIVR